MSKQQYKVLDRNGRPATIEINGIHHEIPRTKVYINPPITQNRRDVHIIANVIEWYNAGNVPVLIDEGYTVEPGQGREMGNTEFKPVFNQNFTVRFLIDEFDGEEGTDEKRLEYTEIRLPHEAIDKNY